MFNDWVERFQPFSQVFHLAGKRVFLVGGALRNRLLGRTADDFDFATDATPDEVIKLFRRVIPTGLQHGTVTVLHHGESFEVTTFRVDGTYSDQRRPDHVAFTSDLAQDLSRRDFTVNALALDLVSGDLIDLFGGQEDLSRSVLRAIGVPGQRFDEDALRILRLFRFASQLGFQADPVTLAAAVDRREALVRVSRERIRDEWLKLWGGKAVVEVWELLESLGFIPLLTGVAKPSVCPKPVLVSWHGLPTLARVSTWLATCCIAGDREAILRNLKLSNHEITEVLAPLSALSALASQERLHIRAKRLVCQWGRKDRIERARQILGALVASGLVNDTAGLYDELGRVESSDDPLFLSDLVVSGKDLLAAGVPAGPDLGRTLAKLLELVWDNPQLNERSILLQQIP